MPILRRSVLAFLHHPHVDTVQVVISPSHREFYDRAVEGLDLPAPVNGGETRQDSVRLGLEALEKDKPDFVMIHDAARPLIDAETITAVRKALDTSEGAIAAKKLVDTLKRGDGNVIADTIDRSNLWQAHTPQAFHYDKILAAHRAVAGQKLTDDAAVAEKSGIPVILVQTNADNMKITNPDDMGRASRLLGKNFGDVRTGSGFDVHKLIPGKGVHLGGVFIEHDRALEGHSDADVVLHALVDAILGAMGEGDIGQHFPPSDQKWKGADSSIFVRHAVRMVNERGGLISNVDVTVICEKPRVGPHREAIRKRIAELLEVEVGRVNIKGTTTERLGFTGREEGIAAQAIATLCFAEK